MKVEKKQLITYTNDHLKIFLWEGESIRISIDYTTSDHSRVETVHLEGQVAQRALQFFDQIDGATLSLKQ